MIQKIHIFGFEVSSYALMSLLGVLLASIYCLKKTPKEKKEDMIFMGCYAFIGALLGSKLLFLLTQLKDIISNATILFSSFEIFISYMFSGFVFYGGLIGGILGSYIYCKEYKLDWKSMFSIGVCFVPLFHCFGRIGCFFSGCCYGIESNSILAIPYYTPFDLNSNATRIPIQLIEAMINLGIFFILSWRLKKGKETILFYLLMYSICRFILEFGRGDGIRGIWLLSTSQWISLIIILIVITYNIIKKKVMMNVEEK